METTKKDTRKYWLLFLVSLVINVLMLIFTPEWCWVPLPFVLTFLVLAMDVV